MMEVAPFCLSPTAHNIKGNDGNVVAVRQRVMMAVMRGSSVRCVYMLDLTLGKLWLEESGSSPISATIECGSFFNALSESLCANSGIVLRRRTRASPIEFLHTDLPCTSFLKIGAVIFKLYSRA
jgi:hypothetical protein